MPCFLCFQACYDTLYDFYLYGHVEENYIQRLGVSPNPSGDHICIDLTPFSSETKITVTDVYGRVVRTMVFPGGRRIDLRLEGAPGVYFLTAESAHQKSRITWYKGF